MLDLAFIRNHPDLVKEAARLKNNPIDIGALLELDQRVLALQHHVEEIRAKQNQLSKSIQQAAKEKNVALRNELIAQGKQLAEQIKQLEPELAQAIEQRSNMLLLVPNIPDPKSPVGKDENDNVPIKYDTVGKPIKRHENDRASGKQRGV